LAIVWLPPGEQDAIKMTEVSVGTVVDRAIDRLLFSPQSSMR